MCFVSFVMRPLVAKHLVIRSIREDAQFLLERWKKTNSNLKHLFWKKKNAFDCWIDYKSRLHFSFILQRIKFKNFINIDSSFFSSLQKLKEMRHTFRNEKFFFITIFTWISFAKKQQFQLIQSVKWRKLAKIKTGLSLWKSK